MPVHEQFMHQKALSQSGPIKPNQVIFANPQSAIRNPQSAIRNPQSAIRNPQSAIRNPNQAQSGLIKPNQTTKT